MAVARRKQKRRRSKRTGHTRVQRDRSAQMEILRLFGKIDYDPGYDYKEERRRKRVPA